MKVNRYLLAVGVSVVAIAANVGMAHAAWPKAQAETMAGSVVTSTEGHYHVRLKTIGTPSCDLEHANTRYATIMCSVKSRYAGAYCVVSLNVVADVGLVLCANKKNGSGHWQWGTRYTINPRDESLHWKFYGSLGDMPWG